jgi:hypothetical protein
VGGGRSCRCGASRLAQRAQVLCWHASGSDIERYCMRSAPMGKLQDRTVKRFAISHIYGLPCHAVMHQRPFNLATTACTTHGHLCVATSESNQSWLTHLYGALCDQLAHCPVRWTAKRVTSRSGFPVAIRATWVMTCPCCTAPPSTSTRTASTTCRQQQTPHALSSGYGVVHIQVLLGVCFPAWHGPKAALAQHHQLAW